MKACFTVSLLALSIDPNRISTVFSTLGNLQLIFYLYKNECSTDHCSVNTFTLPITFPVRVPMRVDHRYRCSTCNATTLLTSLAGPITESSFHCRWLLDVFCCNRIATTLVQPLHSCHIILCYMLFQCYAMQKISIL